MPIHDETRSRILNAAGAAFAEHGYRGTTVRAICREAGVNLAAINYHFGDKERLYIETIKEAHRYRAEQVPLPQWSAQTPAETRLRDFIHTMATRVLGEHGQGWPLQLMMREMLQPTSAARELVEDYFRPHFEMLLEILGELIPEETPQHKRHQLAFSIVGQCLFYRFQSAIIAMMIPQQELAEHFQPDQIAEHVYSLSAAALGIQPSLGRTGDSSVKSGRRRAETAEPESGRSQPSEVRLRCFPE